VSLISRELACVRGHRTLFEKLDFTLAPGYVLLVEGDNGSGKTSLLKMLAGLRAPDHGDILWNGTSIRTLGADYRSQLLWLGHANGLKEDLTAAENLRIAQALHARTDRKINQVLEMVRLRGYKHTRPRLFSAGMKRRLALARLLLQQAPLWILDEPQASLDITGIAMLESFVHQHLADGGMAVMTSHHSVSLDDECLVRLRLTP